MKEEITTFLEGKNLSDNSKIAYFYDLEQFVDVTHAKITETNLRIYQASIADFKPSVQFRCQLQHLINILVCQNEHCLHTLFLFSIKLVYQLPDCILDIVSGTHLFSNYLRITLYLIILFAAEFV